MTTPPADPLMQQVAVMKQNSSTIRDQVKGEYGTARQAGTPEAYRIALTRIRSLQDQLEEYVAFAVTARGGMERQQADAREAYDLAWAQQADSATSAAAYRREDFEGARERYARWDLKVFGQLRALRQAERSLVLCKEMLDEMWLRYRGVNATREDLHQILRAYAFESSLER